MKFIFYLFTTIYFGFSLASLSLAIDDQVTNNLKERLKEVVQTTDINQVKSSNLSGYVGKVTDIIQNTVIMQDKAGKKSISINDDATILRTPGSKTIKLDNIQIDDSIIAIGTLTTQDELTGHRIIVSTNSFTPPEKTSGVATIETIDKYSYQLSLANQSDPLQLYFTSQTKYKSPNETLTKQDIQVGDEIIYTAIKDKDGDWSATIIMKIKSIPSPSISPSPTSSPNLE